MSKNSTKLAVFREYCRKHPEERFWQALRNWSGKARILASDQKILGADYPLGDLEDTFYWE